MSEVKSLAFDAAMVDWCRNQFPSLQRKENDREVVFLDGPAGTQVPNSVISAISKYLIDCNANHGGAFGTSVESDRRMHDAHQALADFVNADSGDEITFGQNMTSLTFSFSRAIAQDWKAGDEVIVTALDHDANISPWLLAARDAGVTIKWVKYRESDYLLDMDDLKNQLSDKTKLIAVVAASNATGGVNPIREVADLAHGIGAQVYVDAVHYGPHDLIDVKAWDCDFLACSTYKFFGPHLGVVWARRELLEKMVPYKVRPASNELPDKWMTGTQSFESIAGGMAAVDYLAEIGSRLSGASGRREQLQSAFQAIGEYEQSLSRQLIKGLLAIDGVKIYGVTDLDSLDQRVPTFSITHPAISSSDLAKGLAEQGVYVWSGHYYALEFTTRVGLMPDGMVRIGAVHYNTPEEIERLLDAISNCVKSKLG